MNYKIDFIKYHSEVLVHFNLNSEIDTKLSLVILRGYQKIQISEVAFTKLFNNTL